MADEDDKRRPKKPRNPVADANRRVNRGGPHGRSKKAERAKAKRELERKLQDED